MRKLEENEEVKKESQKMKKNGEIVKKRSISA